ncbi:MAG: type IX secretion system membrane protein PorP/SprF [Bacteroidetes bacterium]|nr:type IX secretion system membrane protein PorP/SprF [Bacteroidota bacterium]
MKNYIFTYVSDFKPCLSLTLFVIFFCGQITHAQQDPQFTQYMYNTLSYNPAYAGQRDVLSATALYRTQWVGLDGAPETTTVSIHSPISFMSKIGLGLNIIHDELGPTKETYFDIDFSYKIQITAFSDLAFGLKVGGNLLDVDFSQLNLENPNDPAFQENIDNEFNPNFGVGVFYSSDKWYVGLSAPNLVETDHFDRSSNSNQTSSRTLLARERIHYFLMGGYVFDLTPSWQFKPATIFKAVEGAPLQWDASANFMFRESLVLGVAYRWSAAVSGLVGFQISDNLFLGYAYDSDTTNLGEFNSGSHEIFLRFELSKARVRSPRFF